MKKTLINKIVFSFLLTSTLLYPSQKEKAIFFLSDRNNLQFLEESVKNIIISEVDAMYNDLNNQLLNIFTSKIIYTVSVETGQTYFDKDFYELLLSENPRADKKFLESSATHKITKEIKKQKDRVIDVNQIIDIRSPEWQEIVQYFGGYSNLAKTGITIDKANLFTVKTIINNITIKSANKCDASFSIIGNDEYGLKFYQIKKTDYTKTGEINIPYIDYKMLNDFMSAEVKFDIPNTFEYSIPIGTWHKSAFIVV